MQVALDRGAVSFARRAQLASLMLLEPPWPWAAPKAASKRIIREPYTRYVLVWENTGERFH